MNEWMNECESGTKWKLNEEEFKHVCKYVKKLKKIVFKTY